MNSKQNAHMTRSQFVALMETVYEFLPEPTPEPASKRIQVPMTRKQAIQAIGEWWFTPTMHAKPWERVIGITASQRHFVEDGLVDFLPDPEPADVPITEGDVVQIVKTGLHIEKHWLGRVGIVHEIGDDSRLRFQSNGFGTWLEPRYVKRIGRAEYTTVGIPVEEWVNRRLGSTP